MDNSQLGHKERVHKLLSASQWGRLYNCPGSFELSKGIERIESEYAAEGTVLHELVESLIAGNSNGELDALLDAEHLALATKCLDVAHYYHQSYPLCSTAVEELLEINENIGGIVDLVFYKPNGLCIIIDWKFGAGVAVEAEENKQLMIAALGAKKKWNCQQFELVIFQPRISDKPSHWSCPIYTLNEFEAEVMAKEQEILAGSTQLQTGSHCKFCPAKAVCPKQAEEALSLAVQEFKGVQEPLSISRLTPQQIADILDKQSRIEDFLTECRAYALRCASLGTLEIPGYKVVPGKANRKWKYNDTSTAQDLYEVFGIEPWKKELISPAQAEKLIPKDQHAHLAGLIEKPQGKPTLAKISDKRTALSLEVEARTEFTNVTNSTMEKLPWE